jgi:hypothetical protein
MRPAVTRKLSVSFVRFRAPLHQATWRQIRAPFNGIVEYDTAIAGTLIRTPEGKIAFFN